MNPSHTAENAERPANHPEKLKVAVVTPVFPIPSQMYRGRSQYHLVREMAKHAEVEVFCPFSRYPKWFQPRFDHRTPDLSYSPPDVKTRYFEYPAIPGITRLFNGIVCGKYLEPCLTKFRPDLVLNFWLYPEGYAAVQVAEKLGVPAVVCSLGSDLNSIPDRVSNYLTRRTMERAAAVITKSGPLRGRAIAMGINPGKVSAVSNGCDSEVFHVADRKAARKQLGIDEQAAMVLYVGRLDPAKGIVDLLEAFVSLAGRYPNLRLEYVGDGPGRDQLLRKARKSNVQDRVFLADVCSAEEVAQKLAASNVLALPSYAEGNPSVILEALSCGRPVIGTDVGGIPDMMNEECGILVPPRNVPALAKAIEDSMNRHWDERLISKHFRRDWDQVADEFLAICHQVVQQQRGTAETFARLASVPTR